VQGDALGVRAVPRQELRRPGVVRRALAGREAGVERAGDQRMDEGEPVAVAGQQPRTVQVVGDAGGRRRPQSGELAGEAQRRVPAEDGERPRERGGARRQP
jgi:hypothetical protein